MNGEFNDQNEKKHLTNSIKFYEINQSFGDVIEWNQENHSFISNHDKDEHNHEYQIKFISFLRNCFLPNGELTSDYYRYTAWRITQRLVSATCSVFGTQALLLALGYRKNRIGLAAASTWVMKDALGKVSRIFWASKFGRKFDSDAKKWRFRSSVLFAAGNGLEILTYIFPSIFLITAAVANGCKQVAMLTSSATRNTIYKSFSRNSDNIGDITAKGEAQIAVVDIVGMLTGILISKVMNASRIKIVLVFVVLSLIDLFCVYKEIRSVVFQTLNFERTSQTLSILFPMIDKEANETSSLLHLQTEQLVDHSHPIESGEDIIAGRVESSTRDTETVQNLSVMSTYVPSFEQNVTSIPSQSTSTNESESKVEIIEPQFIQKLSLKRRIQTFLTQLLYENSTASGNPLEKLSSPTWWSYTQQRVLTAPPTQNFIKKSYLILLKLEYWMTKTMAMKKDLKNQPYYQQFKTWNLPFWKLIHQFKQQVWNEMVPLSDDKPMNFTSNLSMEASKCCHDYLTPPRIAEKELIFFPTYQSEDIFKTWSTLENQDNALLEHSMALFMKTHPPLESTPPSSDTSHSENFIIFLTATSLKSWWEAILIKLFAINSCDVVRVCRGHPIVFKPEIILNINATSYDIFRSLTIAHRMLYDVMSQSEPIDVTNAPEVLQSIPAFRSTPLRSEEKDILFDYDSQSLMTPSKYALEKSGWTNAIIQELITESVNYERRHRSKIFNILEQCGWNMNRFAYGTIKKRVDWKVVDDSVTAP